MALNDDDDDDDDVIDMQKGEKSSRKDAVFDGIVLLFAEPKNNPGWCTPENEALLGCALPLFVCPLCIDITRQDNKVR